MTDTAPASQGQGDVQPGGPDKTTGAVLEWPPAGWSAQTTLSGDGAWTRSVELQYVDDGLYIATNPRGQTDGMFGTGDTPDEAVDDLVDAIVGCAEGFGSRRSLPAASASRVRTTEETK